MCADHGARVLVGKGCYCAIYQASPADELHASEELGGGEMDEESGEEEAEWHGKESIYHIASWQRGARGPGVAGLAAGLMKILR